MLLEFHTSPYDNPFHPVPLSYLPGFELEVQVSVGVNIDLSFFFAPAISIKIKYDRWGTEQIRVKHHIAVAKPLTKRFVH